LLQKKVKNNIRCRVTKVKHGEEVWEHKAKKSKKAKKMKERLRMRSKFYKRFIEEGFIAT